MGKHFSFIFILPLQRLSVNIGRLEENYWACLGSHPLIERYRWIGIVLVG